MEDWDWERASDEDLVRHTGLMGYRSAPGGISQPAPGGFQAQAELLRRVLSALRETTSALSATTTAVDKLRSEASQSSSQLARYTRWLIWLTILLAVLGGIAVWATLES